MGWAVFTLTINHTVIIIGHEKTTLARVVFSCPMAYLLVCIPFLILVFYYYLIKIIILITDHQYGKSRT